MKRFGTMILIAAVSAFCLFVSSCKTEIDDDPYTGLKLVASSTNADAGGTVTLTGTYYSEDTASTSVEISYALSDDTTGGASLSSKSATSGTSVTLTLGTTNSASVTVTATYGSYSASNTISTNVAISASDTPTGYASTNWSTSASTVKTVTTKSELVTYAKAGGYIIYVDGMIDMSDGMLPTTGGGTTDELDSFVNTKSSGSYTTYSAWKSAYAAACSETTEDGDSDSTTESGLYTMLWTLNKAYGNTIKLSVASNTTIIGADSESGIKGGTIQISSDNNIVLRNLTIQDAYDPFPHHESGDGYNAQWDGICTQGTSSNIWIDHCTIQDTLTLVHVSTGGSTDEKWQTYDGLCDMKGSVLNITVSYCKFMNHDKTMLIGSSDSDGSNSTRTITLHHNYFYNCGQRLPMVRNSKIHIYNNYYDASSPTYTQQYAVGCRAGSLIVAENNYFGSGINYSFKDSYGTLYKSGNTDNSSRGFNSSTTSTMPFTPSYTYTLDSASTAKSSVVSVAGAGTCTVVTD